MTHLQLTPNEQPPGARQEGAPEMEAPGADDAEEMRLGDADELREDLDRAADEGMIESPEEAGAGGDDTADPHVLGGRMTDPALAEGR
jgi:hypothetical protein